MHPLAEALAQRWIGDFWSANHEITWLATEQELSLRLDDYTVLVGRVDATGVTPDGRPFFGEWKTASASKARRMAETKATWRTAPQALTYGVLLPTVEAFTVRWAIKTPQPQTAFEWYTYTPAEIEHWRQQLVDIAHEIRHWRDYAPEGPWRTNFGNCFRYGQAYACPFFADKCSQLQFKRSMGRARVPHLDIEPRIRDNEDSPALVILDASRVSDYLECPEAYRNKWEGEGYQEESEALTIGSDFHALVGAHIQSLIKTQ